MKFTMIMTVYNHYEKLERAVQSILQQDYTDFEVIVLDNASEDKRVAELLEQFAQKDDRLSWFRIEDNVGWPKGISMCLERATGDYFSYLAADDYLDTDLLSYVSGQITMESNKSKNYPEIIWMGSTEDYESLGKRYEIKPEYFCSDNESDICSYIPTLMGSCYYNAVIHFLSIEFIRRNQIDFFYPYYSDCGSMTRALAVTKHMMVLPKCGYHLTRGTSHSLGKYTRYFDDRDMFLGQWLDLKDKILRCECHDAGEISYIIKRIEDNHLGNIGSLCKGGKCQDVYFNLFDLSISEKVEEIERQFNEQEYFEIVQWYGREEYTNQLMQCLYTLVQKGLEDNISIETIFEKSKYLGDIFLAFYNVNEKTVTKNENLDMDGCMRIVLAVLQQENQAMFGIEFIRMMMNMPDETFDSRIVKCYQYILKRYQDSMDMITFKEAVN